MSSILKKHNNFQINIEDTSGPLDLILELIKKKKMDIYNLNIRDLTDQFVQYFNQMSNQISLEEYSDYANMASYLIELKTRSLLPDLDITVKMNNRSFADEQELFIRRLLEYQMYKKAIPLLEKCKTRRSHFFDKAPEDLDEFATNLIPLGKLPKRLNINKLAEAFENVLQRRTIREKIEQPVNLHTSNAQEYSIELVTVDLLLLLQDQPHFIFFSTLFFRLADEKQNIHYFCMLFFVVLSLIRHNYLIIELEENGDFKIKLNYDNMNGEGDTSSFLRSVLERVSGE